MAEPGQDIRCGDAAARLLDRNGLRLQLVDYGEDPGEGLRDREQLRRLGG